MPNPNSVRSAIGTSIFVCAGVFFCYAIYPVLHLTYLAHFDHSKHYDVILPGPLDWTFCALFVAAILIALVRRWQWSTVPLWSLVLFAIGIIFVVNPVVNIDPSGLLMFLVMAIAIQIAVLLRKNYKKSATPL